MSRQFRPQESTPVSQQTLLQQEAQPFEPVQQPTRRTVEPGSQRPTGRRQQAPERRTVRQRREESVQQRPIQQPVQQQRPIQQQQRAQPRPARRPTRQPQQQQARRPRQPAIQQREQRSPRQQRRPQQPRQPAQQRREQAQQFQGQSENPQLTGQFLPATDVIDNPDEVTVIADLPGCDQEDINVQATDGQLRITAQRLEEESEDGHQVRRERGQPAERVVPLPSPVEAEEAEATCENGVCQVRLPKAEEARQREIGFQ